MRHNISITIAKHLLDHEIQSGQKFPHHRIIDLRRCENGKCRPIEETTLKRLKNHFISYGQMSLDMNTSDESDEAHFAETVEHYKGDILVITDQVSQIAGFCQRQNMPFTTKEFYVVETGKGDTFRHVQSQPSSYTAKFGTFAG